MKSFVNFLKHNNLVPIALSFVLLGAGSTYAMQNPERLYSAEDRVVSIDNTYLVDKDLETYSPTVRIADVTEDKNAYYVAYELSTIALVDSVWQDTAKTKTLTVYKDDLKNERDLGSFVTRQLSQVIDRELAQLQKTQTFEKKQISQKQVATTHAGLVGMFMDDKTETIPPHRPPEPEPVPAPAPKPTPKPEVEEKETVEESEPEEPEEPEETEEQENTEEEPEENESEPANNPPDINLLGDAIIYVSIGATYTDLGVHATDPEDGALDTTVALNGEIVEKVNIDTTTSATHTITYTAVDSAGGTTTAERTVVVSDEPPEEEDETSGGGDGGSGGGSEQDDEQASSTPETPASSTPEETGSSTEPTEEETDNEATTTEETPAASSTEEAESEPATSTEESSEEQESTESSEETAATEEELEQTGGAESEDTDPAEEEPESEPADEAGESASEPETDQDSSESTE